MELANFVLAGLGVITAMAVAAWGVVKWFSDRIERKHGEAMSEVATLHTRVNEVRDLYVKRSDLDRDLDQLYSAIRDIKNEQHLARTETNQRLDRVLAMLEPKI